MAYHTLAVKHGGRWGIEFGDSDRQVVKDEQRDSYSGIATKIITTQTDSQTEIDRGVDQLNGVPAGRSQFEIEDIEKCGGAA